MAAQVITETSLAHVGDRATTVNLGERLIGRACAATVVGDRKRARSQDDVARHDAASKRAWLEEQPVRYMIPERYFPGMDMRLFLIMRQGPARRPQSPTA